MTLTELANQARIECAAPEAPGTPHWNVHASQFMFAPTLRFPEIPHAAGYRFTAVDEAGAAHSFDAASSAVSLHPIWEALPEGTVRLTAAALNIDGGIITEVGSRSFFKVAAFPDDLPPAACSYRECAARAFDYTLNRPGVRYWLEHGAPDPDYDHYVYPSKMISAIVTGMLQYAELVPEKAEEAVQLAQNAADYLLGITYGADAPLCGLPPTYYINFRPHPETRQNLSATDRLETVMMIYPASVGTAYLQLERKTGEPRYLDGALAIARFYESRVQPCGSWHLVLSTKTGEALSENFCNPQECIVPFLSALFARTGDAAWKTLADRALAYVEREILPSCNWEAQFEDSALSVQYSNLTHYGACALIRYYCTHFTGDPEKMACADRLMRFAEDQFVLWKRPPVWHSHWTNLAEWHTPAALEQYRWYVPIDASTADLMLTFLAMYRAGRGELYLAKAQALADALTRMQQENGQFPTHWFREEWIRTGGKFWLNCHISAASAMAEMALTE